MERKTILVADDEPNHRDILRTLLRHHGYAVLEATNGAQAVDLAREERPQLVLMDVGLPVIDGWDATRRLKEDPATAAIPVIIVTVHTQESDLVRSGEVGCDGYMAKPCEPTEVLAEVHRWIGAA